MVFINLKQSQSIKRDSFVIITRIHELKYLNLEMSKGPIYLYYNYCHITTKATIMKFIASVVLEISILYDFNV